MQKSGIYTINSTNKRTYSGLPSSVSHRERLFVDDGIFNMIIPKSAKIVKNTPVSLKWVWKHKSNLMTRFGVPLLYRTYVPDDFNEFYKEKIKDIKSQLAMSHCPISTILYHIKNKLCNYDFDKQYFEFITKRKILNYNISNMDNAVKIFQMILLHVKDSKEPKYGFNKIKQFLNKLTTKNYIDFCLEKAPFFCLKKIDNIITLTPPAYSSGFNFKNGYVYDPSNLQRTDFIKIEDVRNDVYICKCCGVPNLITHNVTEDYGKLTTGITCRLCYSDLSVKIEYNNIDCVYSELPMKIIYWNKVGSWLDALLTTLNVDLMDDADHKQNLIKNDSKIVNQFVGNILSNVILVPPNINKFQLDKYEETYQWILPSVKSTMIVDDPEFYMSLATSMSYILTNNNLSEIKFHGFDICPFISNKVHMVAYNYRQLIFSNNCITSSNDCNHKCDVSVYSHMYCMLNLDDIYELLIKDNNIVYLILINTQHYHNYECKDNNLFIKYKHKNYADVVKRSTYENIINFNRIVGNKTINIIPIYYNSYHTILKVIKSDNYDFGHIILSNSNKLMLTLPLVDFKLPNSIPSILKVKPTEVEVDMAFLRTLVIRCINSQQSWNSMREYATSYNLTVSRVMNKIEKPKRLNYNDIEIHIFLAMFISKKFNVNYNLDLEVIKLSQELPNQLRTILFKGMNEASKRISTLLFNYLDTYYHDFKKLLTNSHYLKLFRNYIENPVWDNLLHLEWQPTLRSTNIYLKHFEADEDKIINCIHHKKSECKNHEFKSNKCACCKLYITDNIICDCCKNEFKFPETDYKINIDELDILKLNEDISQKDKLKIIENKSVIPKVKVLDKKVKSNQLIKETTTKPEFKNDNNVEVRETNKDKIVKIIKDVPNMDSSFIIKSSETIINEIVNKNSVTTKNDELILTAYNLFGENYLQCLVDEVTFYNSYDNKNCQLYYPYIPFGVSNVANFIKPKNLISVPNVAPNVCGYMAFNYCFPNLYSLEEFKRISNEKNWFSMNGISRVAEHGNLNLILISDVRTCIIKKSNSDIFKTIFHSGEILKGHWSPGNGYIINKSNILKTFYSNYDIDDLNNIIPNNQDYESVINNIPYILSCMIIINVTEKYDNNILNITKCKSDNCLTNNPYHIHNIFNGFIHIEDKYDRQYFLNGVNRTYEECKNDEYLNEDNVLTQEIDNYERDMVNLMKSYIINLSKFKRDIITSPKLNLKYSIFVNLKRNKNKLLILPKNSYAKRKLEKLKSFDMVNICKDNSNCVTCVIQKLNKHILIYNKDLIEGDYTLIIYKQSTSFIIRQLINYVLYKPDISNIKTKLNNMFGVLGPPGTGKSNIIKSKMYKNCLVLTPTRSSYENLLKNCISKEAKVYTVDVFNGILEEDYEDVFIDEASLVNIFDLYKLFSCKFKNLFIYGDSFQITSSLMFINVNEGVKNVFDYVKPENLTKLKTVYRFGNNILNYVKQIFPKEYQDVTSSCANEGEVVHLNYKAFTDEMFVDLLFKYNPTVVLVYYHNELLHYQDLTDCLVEKVHGYQSKQAYTIMLISITDHNHKSLCNNQKYLLSGLTRAINKLIHVVVDPEQSIKQDELAKLLTIIGGERIKTKLIYLNNLTNSELNEVIKVMEKESNSKITYVRKQDNSIILSLSKMLLKIDLLIKDGNITPLNNKYIYENFIKEYENKDIILNNEELEICNDQFNIDNFYNLCYVLTDLITDHYLNIEHNHDIFTIKYRSNCPLYNSIYIINKLNNELIFYLDNRDFNLNKKYLYFNRDYLNSKLILIIISFLGLNKILKTEYKEYRNTIFEDLNNTFITKLIWNDRIINGLFNVASILKMTDMWQDIKDNNWNKSEKLVNQYNIDIYERSYDCFYRESYIICKESKISRYVKKLIKVVSAADDLIYVSPSKKIECKSIITDCNFRKIINYTLKSLRHSCVNRFGQFIKGNPREAMVKRLSQIMEPHVRIKDNIYYKLIKNLAIIYDKTNEQNTDKIYLYTKDYKLFENYLTNYYPLINVVPLDRSLLGSSIITFLESILIQRIMLTNNLVYHGLYPNLLCYLSRHEINVLNKKVNYVHYEENFRQYNKLIREYLINKNNKDLPNDYNSPYLINDINTNNIVNLGYNLSILDFDIIYDILIKGGCVIGIVPNINMKSDKFSYNNNFKELYFVDLSYGIKLNDFVDFKLFNDKYINYKDQIISCEICFNILDHIVIKLQLEPINIGLEYKIIDNEYNNTVFDTINILKFNTNIQSIIAGDKIIDYRKGLVDRRLLRMLMLHLTIRDRTIEDQLAYGRVLASTNYINFYGLKNNLNNDLDVYINTIFASIILKGQVLSSINVLKGLVEYCYDNEFIASNFEMITNILTNTLGFASSYTHEFINLLFNKLKDELVDFNEYEEYCNDLMVWIGEKEQRVFIIKDNSDLIKDNEKSNKLKPIDLNIKMNLADIYEIEPMSDVNDDELNDQSKLFNDIKEESEDIINNQDYLNDQVKPELISLSTTSNLKSKFINVLYRTIIIRKLKFKDFDLKTNFNINYLISDYTSDKKSRINITNMIDLNTIFRQISDKFIIIYSDHLQVQEIKNNYNYIVFNYDDDINLLQNVIDKFSYTDLDQEYHSNNNLISKKILLFYCMNTLNKYGYVIPNSGTHIDIMTNFLRLNDYDLDFYLITKTHNDKDLNDLIEKLIKDLNNLPNIGCEINQIFKNNRKLRIYVKDNPNWDKDYDILLGYMELYVYKEFETIQFTYQNRLIIGSEQFIKEGSYYPLQRFRNNVINDIYISHGLMDVMKYNLGEWEYKNIVRSNNDCSNGGFSVFFGQYPYNVHFFRYINFNLYKYYNINHKHGCSHCTLVLYLSTLSLLIHNFDIGKLPCMTKEELNYYENNKKEINNLIEDLQLEGIDKYFNLLVDEDFKLNITIHSYDVSKLKTYNYNKRPLININYHKYKSVYKYTSDGYINSEPYLLNDDPKVEKLKLFVNSNLNVYLNKDTSSFEEFIEITKPEIVVLDHKIEIVDEINTDSKPKLIQLEPSNKVYDICLIMCGTNGDFTMSCNIINELYNIYNDKLKIIFIYNKNYNCKLNYKNLTIDNIELNHNNCLEFIINNRFSEYNLTREFININEVNHIYEKLSKYKFKLAILASWNIGAISYCNDNNIKYVIYDVFINTEITCNRLSSRNWFRTNIFEENSIIKNMINEYKNQDSLFKKYELSDINKNLLIDRIIFCNEWFVKFIDIRVKDNYLTTHNIIGSMPTNSTYENSQMDKLLNWMQYYDKLCLITFGSFSPNNYGKYLHKIMELLINQNYKIVILFNPNDSSSKKYINIIINNKLQSFKLNDFNDNIYVTNGINFDKYLSKFKFVIFTGSIGTFNVCINNCVPMIAMPIFVEQWPISFIIEQTKIGICLYQKIDNIFTDEDYTKVLKFINNYDDYKRSIKYHQKQYIEVNQYNEKFKLLCNKFNLDIEFKELKKITNLDRCFNWPTINDDCIINLKLNSLGLYEINTIMNIRLIYNPKTTENCVPLCILYLSDKTQIQYQRDKINKLSNECYKLLNYNDIASKLCKIGYNSIVINYNNNRKLNGYILYTLFNRPFVIFSTNYMKTNHMVLLSCTINDFYKTKYNELNDLIINNEDLCLSFNSYFGTNFQSNVFMNYLNDLRNYRNNKLFKNCIEINNRLSSQYVGDNILNRNLYFTTYSKQYNNQFIKLHDNLKEYYIGELYILMSNPFNLGIYLPYKNSGVLFLFNKFDINYIGFKTGLNMLNVNYLNKKKLNIRIKGDILALDDEAKSLYYKYYSKELILANIKYINSTIIIHNYDNRSHHTINDIVREKKTILEQNDKLLIINNSGVLSEFDKNIFNSYNKAVRKVISKGKIMECYEFDPIIFNNFDNILKLKYKYHKYMNSIITDDEDLIYYLNKCLKSVFSIKDNKIILRFKFNYNYNYYIESYELLEEWIKQFTTLLDISRNPIFYCYNECIKKLNDLKLRSKDVYVIKVEEINELKTIDIYDFQKLEPSGGIVFLTTTICLNLYDLRLFTFKLIKVTDNLLISNPPLFPERGIAFSKQIDMISDAFKEQMDYVDELNEKVIEVHSTHYLNEPSDNQYELFNLLNPTTVFLGINGDDAEEYTLEPFQLTQNGNITAIFDEGMLKYHILINNNIGKLKFKRLFSEYFDTELIIDRTGIYFTDSEKFEQINNTLDSFENRIYVIDIINNCEFGLFNNNIYIDTLINSKVCYKLINILNYYLKDKNLYYYIKINDIDSIKEFNVVGIKVLMKNENERLFYVQFLMKIVQVFIIDKNEFENKFKRLINIDEDMLPNPLGSGEDYKNYLSLINDYNTSNNQLIIYNSSKEPLINDDLELYNSTKSKNYGHVIAKFLPDYYKMLSVGLNDINKAINYMDMIYCMNCFTDQIDNVYVSKYFNISTTTNNKSYDEYESHYYYKECLNINFDKSVNNVDVFMPYIELVNMWDNINLLVTYQVYPNPNMGTIKSWDIVGHVRNYIKSMLTKYPQESRSVWIKNYLSENRVITVRPYRYITYRTLKPSLHETIKRLKEIYFIRNCDDLISNYNLPENTITWDPYGTVVWLKNHPNGDSRVDKIIDYLSGLNINQDISDANIHKKFEDILKDSLVLNNDEDLMRVIIWYDYIKTALFAPLFDKIKQRYKELLNKKVLYADGLTPTQINSWLKQFNNVKILFGSDLSKQDRQVDENLLEIRYTIYELLGLNKSIINLYKKMESFWRWKSTTNSGVLKFMQKTGGPDTSIGNLITSHIVSTTYLYNNLHIFEFGMFLGDDNINGFNGYPNLKNVGWITANYWNIQSKYDISDTAEYFLRLIITIHEGKVEVGPDIIRLCQKFELFKNVNHLSWKDIIPRKMSYLMMLGYDKRCLEVCNKYNWNLPLSNWYNKNILYKGLSYLKKISPEVVDVYFNKLINYMLQDDIYIRNIEYISSFDGKN